jgi:hypothetical protein
MPFSSIDGTRSEGTRAGSETDELACNSWRATTLFIGYNGASLGTTEPYCGDGGAMDASGDRPRADFGGFVRQLVFDAA